MNASGRLERIIRIFIMQWLAVGLIFSLCGLFPTYAEDGQLALLTASQSNEDFEALPFEFMNRHIFTMRSSSMGFSPKERQITIKQRINMAMEASGEDSITIRPTPEGGRFVELNGIAVFQIRPADLDPLLEESIDIAIKQAADNLKLAVTEARAQSKPKVILQGLGYSLLATLLFYLTYRGIYWAEKRLISRLQAWLARYRSKLVVALHPQQLVNAIMTLVHIAKWVLILVAVYEWASFVFRQFPYSRPWGERLQSYLVDTMQGILSAMADALPGLLVVFFIVMLTRFASEVLKAFFSRIESGKVAVSWMAEDTARPTRKLTQALLWLFALAMAYPYLPGSNTEAFKGLSVLVGIMVSIGGSGVVGQAASGLIMIYSHVLREGEYVKIDETEGLVTNVGIFSTKVRTSNGEEVNIPNSLIGSAKTINSSRLVTGNGLVIHTTVTIGYNTPWRQVHAMLLCAAERTTGLRADPKPFISQTALADFYVEYRLTAQVERPELRRITLTALHANIQDAFNEFGVQIMSPHYVGDPTDKVWVPREQWFEAPAVSDSDSEKSV